LRGGPWAADADKLCLPSAVDINNDATTPALELGVGSHTTLANHAVFDPICIQYIIITGNHWAKSYLNRSEMRIVPLIHTAPTNSGSFVQRLPPGGLSSLASTPWQALLGIFYLWLSLCIDFCLFICLGETLNKASQQNLQEGTLQRHPDGARIIL
jgi:hypothetical protein